MSRIQIFSVLDKAVGAFLPPFYARSRGEALRSFTETSNDEKHQFNRHAADFVLYYFGEFDDASGMFATREPERVVSAMESLVPDNPFTEENRLPRVGGANGFAG